MSLTLKSVHSADAENIRTWQPEDPDDVCIVVEIEVASGDSPGADLFQFMVATTAGLARWSAPVARSIVSDRALVLMKTFSTRDLFSWLQDTLARCDAATWPESLCRLQQYFRWEYEDYQPEKPTARNRGRR